MTNEKHLILENNGFFVKDDKFNYADIDATYFYYMQTQKTINFVAHGIDHNVVIKLYLKNRTKPIAINTQSALGFGSSVLGFGSGKNSSEILIAKFNEISRQTFPQRIEKYFRSMEDNGYFLYDGKKFFKNGNVVSDKWEANLMTDKPWLKVPFSIYYEKKAPVLFSSGKRYKIETTMDSDVFFSILEHTYKMIW